MDQLTSLHDLTAEEVAWGFVMKSVAGLQTARRFQTPFGGYADDPVRFGEEILGHRYWEGQKAVMRALVKHRRVALRKCRKTGGTYSAADIALSFLMTAPTIVVTTAPTVRQVRELLWAKIRAAHGRARSRLPGVPGVQSLRLDHDWYAIGIATADPENVLGFHAGVELPDDMVTMNMSARSEDTPPLDQGIIFDALSHAARRTKEDAHRLLLVFDEAPGIPQVIFDALEGSMSGPNTYALMQGNPRMASDAAHAFAGAFRDNSGWFRIHIAAEDPGADPVGSDLCFHDVPDWLIPKTWTEERRREWGQGSPIFQSDVLGTFSSEASEYQFVPPWLLEMAAIKDLADDGRIESRHIGADVGASESRTSDPCVATLWIGGALASQHVWRSGDTMASREMIQRLMIAWSGDTDKQIPAMNVHIDASGVGRGIVDRMREAGLYVDGVDFGTRPRYDWKQITGELRFRNRKSELFWVMRRALQEGLASIPRKYADVWRQLQWMTYDQVVHKNETTIQMGEDKDEIRSKFGRSPDHADASVVAWSRSNKRPTFRLVDQSI